MGKPELQNTKRSLVKDSQWNFLQGTGKIKGQLIGGCVDVLEFLKERISGFQSPIGMERSYFGDLRRDDVAASVLLALRNYAAQGVFNKINGLILGRPYDNKYVQEYNEILLRL